MASPPKPRIIMALLATAVALGLVATIFVTFPAPLSTAAAADTALRPVTSPTTSPSPSPTASPNPTAVVAPVPIKVREPKPASRTRKARNVPALPRDDHHGRRIVYDKALMTVWVMSERDEVLGRYPVVGRFDRPVMGTYRIFSKSKVANNPNSKVTFNHMMRFTYGPDTKSPIGLHAIPRYYDGTAMHSTKQLGLAIAAGGCVRLSEEAAAAIYKWAKVGDRVIVLPSP
ncbi:MAG: L,D-transpeptidase [Candidatus Nanopelagicales bacterium]